MPGGRAVPRLHIVTDDAVLQQERFEALARAAIRHAGDRLALHLRGHATGGGRLHDLAGMLSTAADESGALLLVNDRVDVALCTGAHGVQLGRRALPVAVVRRLLPDALIGSSAHSAAEAAETVRDGTDFVVLGTIYSTASHPAQAGAGTGLVADAASRSGVPVIAIGGITPARIAQLADAGAWGAAVLSGVWKAADAIGAVDAYLAALTEAYRGTGRRS